MLNAVMLNAIVASVNMVSVIMLNAVMLSGVASTLTVPLHCSSISSKIKRRSFKI